MAKLKSAIAMKFFRGGDSQDDILAKLYVLKSEGKENYLKLGQLLGEGIDFQDRENVMKEKDGTEKLQKSVCIVGSFEAVCFATGEVQEAAGAYLPAFFADMVKGMVKSGERPSFAIEIGAELTGRSIPWSWVVTNLAPPSQDSAIQKLKRQLAARGELRLPAPVSDDYQAA